MSIKKNKIYALINSKTQKNIKDILSTNDASLAGIVCEYIQGDRVNQEILIKLKPQDTLVVENVLALGKDLNEIINTLNTVADYGINLCFAQENISFKSSKLSEVASSLLLTLRLYQSLFSLRSKMVLQERKSKGLKLGRPFGSNSALKLDDHKKEIKELLSAGVSKNSIAEKYSVCRTTVYNFVKKNPELFIGE